VEFNERGSLTIVELAKLVEQAFVSRRSGERQYCYVGSNVYLFDLYPDLTFLPIKDDTLASSLRKLSWFIRGKF
jgi:hypothetical protein